MWLLYTFTWGHLRQIKCQLSGGSFLQGIHANDAIDPMINLSWRGSASLSVHLRPFHKETP